MSEAKGKKRPRSYYVRCARKNSPPGQVQPGYQGFLVTCNNNNNNSEKRCVRETYGLLNYYGDKFFGPEKLAPATIDHSNDSSDIEDQLRNEIEDSKRLATIERRFQVIPSGAKNCLFVKTTVPDPCDFVHKLLLDIKETQQQRSHGIFRVLPVSVICKAYMDDISKAAESLLAKYFQGVDKTYATRFKARNNSTITSAAVIAKIGEILHQLNSATKANLTAPDLTVLVEVICNYCCLSVIADYNLLKRYNVCELLDQATDTSQEKATARQGSPCKNVEEAAKLHDNPTDQPTTV